MNSSDVSTNLTFRIVYFFSGNHLCRFQTPNLWLISGFLNSPLLSMLFWGDILKTYLRWEILSYKLFIQLTHVRQYTILGVFDELFYQSESSSEDLA